MSSQKPFKILFVCTGNTARSIFGEYLIRRLGQGRFESYSAGADPKPKVNPYALQVLSMAFKIDPSSARPKSWDEYRDVVFDIVITVCDNAKKRIPFHNHPIGILVKAQKKWLEWFFNSVTRQR